MTDREDNACTHPLEMGPLSRECGLPAFHYYLYSSYLHEASGERLITCSIKRACAIHRRQTDSDVRKVVQDFELHLVWEEISFEEVIVWEVMTS